MKKMKSFMEGIGKNFVIKEFYENFLTLKGKFHHQSQNTPKFDQCAHIKTIRKEDKNKSIFRILLREMTILRIIFSKIMEGKFM